MRKLQVGRSVYTEDAEWLLTARVSKEMRTVRPVVGAVAGGEHPRGTPLEFEAQRSVEHVNELFALVASVFSELRAGFEHDEHRHHQMRSVGSKQEELDTLLGSRK